MYKCVGMQNTKVVDVSLCHEYFNGSACGLKVIPSSKTAEILKNEHSQCRIYDGKVKLIAPLDAFRCESVLFFYVKASIAEVWNVTCFDGIAYDKFPVVVVSENGNVDFVGRDKRSVPNLDRMFGVIFGLEIHVGPSRKFECTVTIPTKKMRWGYCFSGSYAERNLQINDSLKADDPVQFDCVEKTSHFSLYVSRREIPIVSGAPPRFQLLDSATSKVLIKKLPNANAKSFIKARLDDGTRTIVAECLVDP